jgi:hypothetical protein
MAAFPLEVLRTAYEDLLRVSEECRASGDFNAYADLFTEDCTYVEHVFGEMHGREAVREWIVPLMNEPLFAVMTYSWDWVLFDEENGRVVLCARSHLPELGDGIDYSTTNWTRLDYAGDRLWSRQEDIYNPANWETLITAWQTACDAATQSGS